MPGKPRPFLEDIRGVSLESIANNLPPHAAAIIMGVAVSLVLVSVLTILGVP